MKYLLLLAVVAYANAQFWEPSADDKHCIVCSDPWVRTFDGYWTPILEAQKTRLTVSRVNHGGPATVGMLAGDDGCRFGVTGVTKDNWWGGSTSLFLDWIGVALHIHPNPERALRNWVLGQKDTSMTMVIGERGNGIAEMNLVPLGPYTFPPYCPFNLDWPLPAGCDCPTYEVFEDPSQTCYSEAHELTFNMLKIRSTCCDWAIDWYPCAEDTCLTIWIGEYYHGKMFGMCGNANDDWDDDRTTCKDKYCGNEDPWECMNLISKHCDATRCCGANHNGAAFPGGQRI